MEVGQQLRKHRVWPYLSRLSLIIFCVWVMGFGWLGTALAGELADRLAVFPNWQTPPPLHKADGFLVYPDWFLGHWQVTSTLVDLVAPLAPEIMSPGFTAQQDYLNHPVEFDIRFIQAPRQLPMSRGPGPQPPTTGSRLGVIADQRYNSLSLAAAVLGDRTIRSVTVDPQDPNRQVTQLRGGRQLTSTISQRGQEQDDPNHVITSELFQQIFRSEGQLYLNQVENTTAYAYTANASPHIEADQVTAIYLSPQDPNYFKAGSRPVALYRYHLVLKPLLP